MTFTDEQLQAAQTANRAILLERFPSMDVSVGGPVDSVLVNGNATVTAQNTSEVERAYLYQQLRAISLGEVEVSDEDLDRLMANYFLTRQTEQVARGTVRVVASDNLTQVFSAGSVLFYSGLQYQLEQTFAVYPVGTTGVDFSQPGNVQKQQIYDAETGFEFQFFLPIASLQATPEAVRVVGDRFTAGAGFSFDTLGYIEASTNFNGGFPAETNQRFASRGLQGVLSKTVCGNDSINALVASVVQRGNANSVGINDPMMTRDRQNVFGISTGGKVDTYFKAGAITTASYIVDAVVVSSVLHTATITLTREQSAGAYRVRVIPAFTSAPPVVTSGDLSTTLTTHTQWIDTTANAFNPTLPQEIDRAFSSRQQIVLSIEDTRQVGAAYVVDMSGGVGTVLTAAYQVIVEFQAQLIAVDDALSSAANRPPGVDVVTKAAVPCVASIGIVASRPVNYNGPGEEAIAASVASLVNQLPLTTAELNPLVLSGILKSVEPSLALQSVALNGTIYGQDGVDISVAPVAGRLTIPEVPASKVSPRNTYFTTTSSLVSVALV